MVATYMFIFILDSSRSFLVSNIDWAYSSCKLPAVAVLVVPTANGLSHTPNVGYTLIVCMFVGHCRPRRPLQLTARSVETERMRLRQGCL